MHLSTLAEVLFLLAVANGAPVLLKRLAGPWLAHPVDLGYRFLDQRRVFGSSKTIRGVIASLVLTTAAAAVIGLDAKIGTLIGGMAMAGDLLTSFIKRRLNFAPSARMTGLDQIPEALVPLLACRDALSLTMTDVIIGTACFSVGSVILSPLFYRLGIRDQPF